MKKTLIFFLNIFSLTGIFSQNQLTSKEVLDKVLNNLKSHKTIELDFVIQMEDRDSEDSAIAVNVKMSGNKYLLQETKELIICDGVKMYRIDTTFEYVDEKNVSELDSGEIWPNQLLTFYEQGFNNQGTGIKKDNQGRSIMSIEITPVKGRKFNYRSVLLKVDINKFEITSITLRDKGTGSDEVSFEIRSVKYNVEMNDSLFTYDKLKYKGYK